MSHDQNDNFKTSDKSSGNDFELAANKAGMLMRDEIYGSGPNHNSGDGHNHNNLMQNFGVPSSSENQNRLDQRAISSLDKAPGVMPIGDGHDHSQAQGKDSTIAGNAVAPIGLDGTALSSMLQNGALTYQQAIAMSSPQLASYLSNFRNSKPGS